MTIIQYLLQRMKKHRCWSAITLPAARGVYPWTGRKTGTEDTGAVRAMPDKGTLARKTVAANPAFGYRPSWYAEVLRTAVMAGRTSVALGDMATTA